MKLILKAVDKASFCLSNILYAAYFTSHAVNQIRALARNVSFAECWRLVVTEEIFPPVFNFGQYLQSLL